MPDFAVFAWDARGQGRSPGERGFSPSLGTSVRDVQTFVEHITATYAIAAEDIAVVAQSVGAVLVATWAHDYAPNIRCMVLASPAFKVKLYVPFARSGLKLMRLLRGNFFVNSYVKARFLTHDLERIKSYDSDPLIARPIAVNILLALYETAERIVADARAITIPTQLLISGADFVVHHAPQHRFFERLGSPIKERHVLPGFYHDTFGEEDRAVAVDHARRFILARFAEPWSRPSLLASDRVGFTRDESDQLASPFPLLSPRGLLLGRGAAEHGDSAAFSRTGFDSAIAPASIRARRSTTCIATSRAGSARSAAWSTRFISQSIGWRGIRQRKIHLEELLRATMARMAQQGRPVRVMDIAAGHGRYVLEALEASPIKPESILLRDYSEHQREGRQELIRKRASTPSRTS